MLITKNQLIKIIRESLRNNFISHTYEPANGDRVINTNPQCMHFGSKGNVIKISDLPKDMGKTISYKVTNKGPTFDIGDILIKTLDQLELDID